MNEAYNYTQLIKETIFLYSGVIYLLIVQKFYISLSYSTSGTTNFGEDN